MPIPEVRPKGDLLAVGSHLSALPTRGANGSHLWNRHIAVELASCQFQYIFARAAHSTPIQRENSATLLPLESLPLKYFITAPVSMVVSTLSVAGLLHRSHITDAEHLCISYSPLIAFSLLG
ncbi:MAG: hypothetical protein F6K65_04490 [Moorea sp. SIO3C2]|nr:hypothetical protein [Moorena sp. SIO3C2]